MSVAIASVAESIRTIWPDFQFREEHLQKPTKEFVMRVYKRFLEDIDKNSTYVLGSCEDNLIADLSAEEVLYLRIQNFQDIFNQLNLKFELLDIYKPHPLRTRQFLKILFHYLSFFNITCTNFEKHATEIIGINSEISKLDNECEQLKSEVNNIANTLGSLQGENEELEKQIMIEKEKTKDYITKTRSNLQIKFQAQRKELESIKKLADMKRDSINQLKIKESKLVEEFVTEEEFKDLKELLKKLEIESETLLGDYDCNMDTICTYNSEVLDHLRECRQAMSERVNTELVEKVISIELKLGNWESKKSKLLSKLSTQKTILSNEKKELENAEKALNLSKEKHSKVSNDVEQAFQKTSLCLQKLEEKHITELKECQTVNENLKAEISTAEKCLEKLTEHIETSYVEVSQAEHKVFSKFKQDIDDLHELADQIPKKK